MSLSYPMFKLNEKDYISGSLVFIFIFTFSYKRIFMWTISACKPRFLKDIKDGKTSYIASGGELQKNDPFPRLPTLLRQTTSYC